MSTPMCQSASLLAQGPAAVLSRVVMAYRMCRNGTGPGAENCQFSPGHGSVRVDRTADREHEVVDEDDCCSHRLADGLSTVE